MKTFERPGPVNTEEVINIVVDNSFLSEYIVVASITGDSAIKVAEKVKDKKVICVTCPQGMHWEVEEMDDGLFAEIPELSLIRDEWIENDRKKVPMKITDDNKKRLKELGVKIVQSTIPFFGPNFSTRLHLDHTSSFDILAKTLELISTGTLVCLESVLMAVDSDAVPENKEVIALAGTERGLDTAWVIKSSASANLFHPEKGCRFIELLAKPKISAQPDIDIEYLR